MNRAFRSLLLAFAVSMTAQQATAEEWRGLKPLSSTRADVVRVFGECADKEKRCEFIFQDESVSIDFSGPDICNGRSDTVLLIKRALRNAASMKALGFDKRHFKSFDPSFPRNTGYRAFVDEKSGLLFKTLRGEVFEIYYAAPKAEEDGCSNYFGNTHELLQVVFEHVFMVNRVSCPPTMVDGEKVSITADYPLTGQHLVPTWYTTGGRIVAGQWTRKILLDTTGLAGKVFTVTIEVEDGSHHIASGSCSIGVSAAHKN